jgi:hypothetical protein
MLSQSSDHGNTNIENLNELTASAGYLPGTEITSCRCSQPYRHITQETE